jgi:excisionase family DNA binding protein
MDRDLLTVDEASALTGWTKSTIYSKLSRREITKVKLGPRSVRIRRSALQALMHEVPALSPLYAPLVEQGGAR